jgi:hypothetical protein
MTTCLLLISGVPVCMVKDPPFILENYILGFYRARVVSVCFGLLRNRSVCFGCFDIGSKHQNKPKILVFGFTKQTETNAKQILFRFVSVRTEIYFCLFRGHPSLPPSSTFCGAGQQVEPGHFTS